MSYDKFCESFHFCRKYGLIFHRPPDKIAYLKIIFSYFSTKTYVVGTQKNRLNETVLLSSQKHTFKLMGKEINTILGSQMIFIWTYDFM